MLSQSTIKKIRSLHKKKFRKDFGEFIVEGSKIVEELMNSDYEVVSLYSTESYPGGIQITEKELKKISALQTPNKLLAVVKMPSFALDSAKSALILDGVRDPGNLGTIIRLADWYGIEQVVCSTDAAECFNPKVVQASMGSLFRIKVAYTDLKTYLSSSGLKTYAAVMDGEESAARMNNFNLIMGSESHGIRDGLDGVADHRITIAKKGAAESLNVGVATGILLDRLTVIS
ncbi:MAG: RNA methyltransferase [Flavobacteriales bacterium]|nr:RNA methyltransferase [Flavobacteriales bacterium]